MTDGRIQVRMTPPPSIVWLLSFWPQTSQVSLFDIVAIISRPGKYNNMTCELTTIGLFNGELELLSDFETA